MSEQYRYQLFDHHGTVLETVIAETLNEAAEKFGMKIVQSFYGFAVLAETNLTHWSVRWQSIESVNEHTALLACADALEKLIDAAHWTPTNNWNIGPMDSSKGGKIDMARTALANLKAVNA